ncbi:toll-like receptor f [Plakobranchus ocellatus]|uniref:Toll-like receptor f n=1 Tax=Plakobranchus ocellatus TaxID=259542 RepID=A0AAV4DAP3_9GAST|nr:toll-like receptor f [Plakobranchus ocellatus]
MMRLHNQHLLWVMALSSTNIFLILTALLAPSQTSYIPSSSKEGPFKNCTSQESDTAITDLTEERSRSSTTLLNVLHNSDNSPFVNEQADASGLKSYDCPTTCFCYSSHGKTPREATVVDCSNKGLTRIPKLPRNTTQVYLQGNSISSVPCSSFTDLKYLEIVDLSRNTLDSLAGCSFANLTTLQQLRLSACHLSSLPAGVFDSLQSLIELDLSVNSISHIERDFFVRAAKLKHLNLYGNDLTKLRNRTFVGLKSLKFLTLQSNKLRYLPETFEAGAFIGLDALETLHIQGNQPDFPLNFTYPDEALSSLTSLRYLTMDGYPRALGPGFASLVHLSHLSFRSGDVDSFCSMYSEIPPKFFAHLITKQQLTINMSSCSFITIPPELFTFLPTIHTLDLSHNFDLLIDGFEKASEGLRNSTLAVLNISDIVNTWIIMSEIKNSTFRYLKHTKLKILLVESNRLMNIDPQAILDLPNTMEYISIQDNKISNAYALLSFLHMTKLKIAKISKQLRYRGAQENIAGTNPQNLKDDRNNNTIVTINPSNKNISGHHKLMLHTKYLRDKPYLDYRYKGDNLTFSIADDNLKYKDFCGDSNIVAGQYQKRLKNSFVPIPLPNSLEEFYASDIKASYDIPRVQFFNNRVLKYLDYSRNDIKCFGGPVYGVPNLLHLDLSQNWCHRVNPIFFSSMPSLKTLFLYKNMLGDSLLEDTIGKTFSTLYHLEILDLSTNSIGDLSSVAFVNNVELQILNLSYNHISDFLPDLSNNSKLTTLDLSFNTLSGLSEYTCKQFLQIKRRNSNFTVRIRRNKKFLCNCEHFYFLNFLLDHPEIFEDVSSFQCKLFNNSVLYYPTLATFVPRLAVQCAAQTLFIGTVIVFLLVVGSFALFALYHFKRWQWKYLYYVSKSRHQIRPTLLATRPAADVFITYDQDDRPCRWFMKEKFRHQLHKMDVTTVLGEVDFDARPQAMSIAEAVTNTRKTVVFLSKNIFEDYYRQLEVNIAIMHELHFRRPVLIPVLLLREDRLVRHQRAPKDNNMQAGAAAGVEQPDNQHETRVGRHNTMRNRRDNREASTADDYAKFKALVSNFPSEIATFLKGQTRRCLIYEDNEEFWRLLKTSIFDE